MPVNPILRETYLTRKSVDEALAEVEAQMSKVRTSTEVEVLVEKQKRLRGTRVALSLMIYDLLGV